MKKKLVTILCSAGLLALALLTACKGPSAGTETVVVTESDETESPFSELEADEDGVIILEENESTGGL